MLINAENLDFKDLNDAIRQAGSQCHIQGCLGQRFIGAGMNHITITIDGTPGNALGAYLNGAKITVKGNTQDAVGDTMNDGEIIVYGNIGDAAGYAMRGGKLFVKGNAGYRAGIHMKAYNKKIPVMVIGGSAGSFLGEYQAGGIIIVLGLQNSNHKIVGNFPCTGMHGGKMYLRGTADDIVFPDQVTVHPASEEDMNEIREYILEYCSLFDFDFEQMMHSPFTVITPDSKNPYKQMYVAN